MTEMNVHVQVRRAGASAPPAKSAAAAARSAARLPGSAVAALRRRWRKGMYHADVHVVEPTVCIRDEVKVLAPAGLIRQRKQAQQMLRRWIELRRWNACIRERDPGRRIDDRPSESGEVAVALGDRRHGRERVVRIGRVVSRVVDEEERVRAVDDFRNHQWTAHRRGVSLGQIAGLRRVLAAQRSWRGIEHRTVERLGNVAADLIAASAAERTAESAAAKTAALFERSRRTAAAAGAAEAVSECRVPIARASERIAERARSTGAE